MKSNQKKKPGQNPEVVLTQKNSTVTLHVYKNEEKVPLKVKKPDTDPKSRPSEHSTSSPSYFSVLAHNIQNIFTPSNTPSSKITDGYVNPLLDDTVLESLKAQISAMKKEVRDEEKSGRLHIFNKKINELTIDVKYKIARKAEIITQIDYEDKNVEAKLQRVSDFREERDNFKEEINIKIKMAEQELLESTKKELYDHLKQAIVNPIWELQVNQRFGGKAVLKSESPKTSIQVPTGIEKMIRVLSDSTLPKDTSCCCVSLFTKPAPASRIIAQNEEMLTAKKVLKKIGKLIEIAKERLKTSKNSSELTKRFYSVVAGIDVNRLEDFETLNEYVFKFEKINGNNSIENYLMRDEEAEEENIRRRPAIVDVP